MPLPEVPSPSPPPDLPKLEFFNGTGGFDLDGREYVTILHGAQSTPAPWINVIANPTFGFQVSAEGSGHVWSENSRENQITPWSNDPVTDPSGEAIYLRDMESGQIWTPTALRRTATPRGTTHHGRRAARCGCNVGPAGPSTDGVTASPRDLDAKLHCARPPRPNARRLGGWWGTSRSGRQAAGVPVARGQRARWALIPVAPPDMTTTSPGLSFRFDESPKTNGAKRPSEVNTLPS
jgi:hypothetical protein